jgi:hypothetical protein
MTKNVLLVIAVISAVLALIFSNVRHTHDYSSGARGLVVDDQGHPLSGADVTITFQERVFEAITPLRRATATTDGSGRFSLTFIACSKPGAGYHLRIEKKGFIPETAFGSGHGASRIRLRKAT